MYILHVQTAKPVGPTRPKYYRFPKGNVLLQNATLIPTRHKKASYSTDRHIVSFSPLSSLTRHQQTHWPTSQI